MCNSRTEFSGHAEHVRFGELDLFDPFDEIFVLSFCSLLVGLPFHLSFQLFGEILLTHISRWCVSSFTEDIRTLIEWKCIECCWKNEKKPTGTSVVLGRSILFARVASATPRLNYESIASIPSERARSIPYRSYSLFFFSIGFQVCLGASKREQRTVYRFFQVLFRLLRVFAARLNLGYAGIVPVISLLRRRESVSPRVGKSEYYVWSVDDTNSKVLAQHHDDHREWVV